MTQARVTTTALEVLVEPNPSAQITITSLEVLHSLQEAPPAPPVQTGRRRAVVIVMG